MVNSDGGAEPEFTARTPARVSGNTGARPTIIVVMGVAGAGKTTVGRALAASQGWAFHDADDFHSAESRAKMRAGIPLTDSDRAPWLSGLCELLQRHLATGMHVVLACSALREAYRAALIPRKAPMHSITFVQLDVSPALAEQRLSTRRDHYMQPSLVPSQFATLEEPRYALRLDAARPVPELVAAIVAATNPEHLPGGTGS
ncbi:MAG: gluconokinase [Gemmatimonadaceae bacterium]